MSYLEQLLQGVDVEWKTLGEIVDDKFWIMPSTPKFINEEEIPYITSKNICGGHISFDKIKHINQSAYIEISKNRPIIPGDFLISMIGTIGEVAMVKDSDLPFYGQNMYLLRFNSNVINNRYFLHFFDSPKMKSHFSSVKNNSGQGYLKSKDIENISIPIPCPNNLEKSISIQKEIVRILDTFTGLIEELKTELNARKKQFSHYSDQLFSFAGQDIYWKPLGEIGEFQRGKRFVKTDMISEGVPCIHYGEMYTYFGPYAYKTKSFVSKDLVERKKLRVAKKNDVVLVGAGETIEDIGMGTAWLGEESAVTHDACFSYRSPLNPKYVAYFSRTLLFHNQIKKHIRTGKISAINEKGLSKAKIPVPSIEEQERIVSILDKFDTLTTSKTEGLPAEIEMRQKQYEYYRDMLLTFPKDKIEA